MRNNQVICFCDYESILNQVKAGVDFPVNTSGENNAHIHMQIQDVDDANAVMFYAVTNSVTDENVEGLNWYQKTV